MDRELRSLVLLAMAACTSSAPERRGSELEGCAKCHMAEFRATKSPPHEGTRPTSCGVCHSQTAWRPSIHEHPWPLTGAHEKTSCLMCHVGTPPKLHGTSKACLACHKADFERGPEHVVRKFPATCEACHATTAWTDLLDKPAQPIPPSPSARPAPPRASGSAKGK
jgi:hypothetical protein